MPGAGAVASKAGMAEDSCISWGTNGVSLTLFISAQLCEARGSFWQCLGSVLL